MGFNNVLKHQTSQAKSCQARIPTPPRFGSDRLNVQLREFLGKLYRVPPFLSGATRSRRGTSLFRARRGSPLHQRAALLR